MHDNYTTHVSYLHKKDPLMLDIFTHTTKGFKRVRDCRKFEYGIKSDHAAIIAKISITLIKHNGKPTALTNDVTDWGNIMKD